MDCFSKNLVTNMVKLDIKCLDLGKLIIFIDLLFLLNTISDAAAKNFAIFGRNLKKKIYHACCFYNICILLVCGNMNL